MNLTYIRSYTNSVLVIINSYVVPVLFSVAFLYFLYGVYRYLILGADSDTERAKGRQFVLWSVIGFTVITAVWGIVAIVTNTLNISSGGYAPPYPAL